jgi:plastocyanin
MVPVAEVPGDTLRGSTAESADPSPDWSHLMQKLLNDRRLLYPVVVTAIAIAVGAVLIVMLSSDPASGASAATPASQGATKGAVTVNISDYKFAPAALTVKAGTKVTWINHDSSPHTATATSGGTFDTGTLKKGDKKTLTLRKRGTYAYICEFHPFMKATVIVK